MLEDTPLVNKSTSDVTSRDTVVSAEPFPDPVPKQSQKKLRLMQLAMFMLTYVNYGILHATRSSWSLATNDLLKVYGFSTTIVADMNTDFLFCYSVGGFFLSHLGDKYQKNRLILLMYSGVALTEVALGCLMYFPNL